MRKWWVFQLFRASVSDKKEPGRKIKNPAEWRIYV